jgi:hypothetical protein
MIAYEKAMIKRNKNSPAICSTPHQRSSASPERERAGPFSSPGLVAKPGMPSGAPSATIDIIRSQSLDVCQTFPYSP